MKIESKIDIEGPFEDRLTQEEKHFFTAFRFTSWTGGRLKPGERVISNYTPKQGFSSVRVLPEPTHQMMDHAFNILKRVFEEERGRKISRVHFVQERSPGKKWDPFKIGIDKVGGATWHNHVDVQAQAKNPIELKSKIIVLADGGATEFVRGEFDIPEQGGSLFSLKSRIHDGVEAALKAGLLEKVSVHAGNVGAFNGVSIHKRGKFHDDEPRVVMVVEFEEDALELAAA